MRFACATSRSGSRLALRGEALEDAVDDVEELAVAVLLVAGDARGVLRRLVEEEAEDVGLDALGAEAVAELLEVARVEDLLVLVSAPGR